MFARIVATLTCLSLVLPVLAAASAVPRTDSPPPVGQCSSQCNTGTMQCCNSVQSANTHDVTTLAGLLGIALGPVTGLVGLTCSPLSGGNSCNAQPVCCTGNNFSGLIVIGCTPININL